MFLATQPSIAFANHHKSSCMILYLFMFPPSQT